MAHAPSVVPAVERFAAALLCIGIAFYTKACGQVPPGPAHTTLITDSLVASLDAVADTATIEHYRCLLGGQRGDTLVIVRAFAPPILHADYNTVTAAGCPRFTVGTWHTHLPYNIPMNDPHNRASRVDPWSVCDLSPADRASAKTEPWTFSMISVAKGVHCAWQRTVDADGIRFVRLPWALP